MSECQQGWQQGIARQRCQSKPLAQGVLFTSFDIHSLPEKNDAPFQYCSRGPSAAHTCNFSFSVPREYFAGLIAGTENAHSP